MLTNSRDIVRRLEGRDGHLFASPAPITFSRILPPVKQWWFRTPRRTWEKASSVPFIRAQDGSLTEIAMAHYIAIIEDAGPDHAVGVWFPDLPGCTSAGDDIDDSFLDAAGKNPVYAESFEADGKPMPRPRTLTELKSDPEIADDIKTYMVALIELPARAHAAE